MQGDPPNKNRQAFLCGVASFAATFASNLLHPLEVLKTRFQSHDGKPLNNLVPKYKGIASALRDIVRSEGLLGLYKGFILSFTGNAVANSLFFFIYQRRKLHYQIKQSLQQVFSIATWCSTQAGVLTAILTQPMWVVKTRMLLNTRSKISGLQNLIFVSKQIMRQHGVGGFYRGLTLNILLSLNGIVQMQTYQMVSFVYRKYNMDKYLLGKAIATGAMSKLISSIVSHPLTTIRTRIQQNQFMEKNNEPKYQGILDIVGKILREEGVGGFFKGLFTNLMKGTLQRGLYFYFYEQIKWLLGVNTRTE